jgi:hypothetical protein
MSIFEEIGDWLGYKWHERRFRKNQVYRYKHRAMDNKTSRIYRDVIKKFTTIDKETGKPFAKLAYEQKLPQWFWLVKNFPEDTVNEIKRN